MRFTVSVFGHEVLSVSTGDPVVAATEERDHLAAQVEVAGPAPIGFRISPIPSLEATDDLA